MWRCLRSPNASCLYQFFQSRASLKPTKQIMCSRHFFNIMTVILVASCTESYVTFERLKSHMDQMQDFKIHIASTLTVVENNLNGMDPRLKVIFIVTVFLWLQKRLSVTLSVCLFVCLSCYQSLYLSNYELDLNETWWKCWNLGPIDCIKISLRYAARALRYALRA